MKRFMWLAMPVILLGVCNITYAMSMKMFPKGRFYGYTAPNGTGTKIPTTLDLYIAQEVDDYKKLKGILKFSLGGFDSSEYASYFYDDIHYSWMENKIYLNLDNREILIDELAYKDGKFVGKMSLISGENQASLELVHESQIKSIATDVDQKIFPKRTSISTINSEYSGRCKGKKSILQLETSKWEMRQDESKNFLNGYMVRGRMAGEEQNLCKPGKAYCVSSVFHAGVYDVFSNKVILHGRPSSTQCEVAGNETLHCGDCRFTKITSLFDATREESVSKPLNEVPGEDLPEMPSEEELSGEFTGLLHYEGRSVKQPLKIRVNAYSYNDRPNRPELTYIAVNAWLDFGSLDESNKNQLAIDFTNRRYLSTIPHLLLEGDHGFEFLVERWTDEAIEGTAFSKQFGRVGKFQVAKTSPIRISSTEKFPRLAGRYGSNTWDMNLEFLGETGEVPDSYIFPVSIKGFLQMKGLTSMYYINDFSFDIFTGNIAVKISGDRYFYLKQTHEGLFKTHIPSIETWGAVLKRYKHGDYLSQLTAEQGGK